MTTRDNRIFHRYCPWYRRVLGAALTLLILPPLTGLDLLAQQTVRDSIVKQETDAQARAARTAIDAKLPAARQHEAACELVLKTCRQVVARLDTGADTGAPLKDIETLATKLGAIQLATMAEWTAARGRLVANGAAARILDRHEATRKALVERFQELERLLGQVHRNQGDAARLRASLQSLIGFLSPAADRNASAAPGRQAARACWAVTSASPSESRLQAEVAATLQRAAHGVATRTRTDAPGTRRHVHSRPASNIGAGPGGRAGTEPSALSTRSAAFHRRYPGLSRYFAPVQVAAAGDVISGLLTPLTVPSAVGLPAPDDLAATPDIQKDDPAIVALANELNNHPVKIFEYVRNSFAYEPYFGSVKGAKKTLIEKAGNDMDLASLLMALLRAANVPCRYVFGTIAVTADEAAQWIGVNDPNQVTKVLTANGIPNEIETAGGAVSTIRLDHVWIKAYVDYFPFRAAAPGPGDTWIEIDGSFKQNSFTGGRDIESQVGIHPETLLTNIKAASTIDPAGNYATNLPEEFILAELFGLVEPIRNYLAANSLTTETVFRQRRVGEERFGILPVADQYRIVARGMNFSTLPPELRYRLAIALKAADGSDSFLYNSSLPELADARITLSYAPETADDAQIVAQYANDASFPAYLVSLVPRLRVNGAVVASGQPVGMGRTQKLALTFRAVDGSTELVQDEVIAGSCQALVLNSQVMVAAYLDSRRAGLEQTAAKLVAAQLTDLTVDNTIGDVLHGIGVSYFHQIDRFNQITAGSLGVAVTRAPSLIRVSWDLSVASGFGLPFSAAADRVRIDVDRDILVPVAIEREDRAAENQFLFTAALTGSALEHNGLIQPLIAEAASTVRLIQAASKQGIKVYTVTPANVDAVAAILEQNLPLAARSAIADIRDAVNAGREVTAPERVVSIHGVDYYGFIKRDLDTSASDFVLNDISGGEQVNSSLTPADLLQVGGASRYIQPLTTTASWLKVAQDATTNAGLSYLPAITSINNWYQNRTVLDPVTTIAAAIAVSGPITKISAEPAILNAVAGPDLISPNGDGIRDAFTVTADVTRQAQWTVTIGDNSGNPVATATDTTPELEFSFSQPVADGTYSYRLTAVAGDIQATPVSGSFRLDRTAPTAVLSVSSRTVSGATAFTFRGTASDANFDSWLLEAVDADTGAKVRTLAAGDQPVVDANFAVIPASALPNGSYRAELAVLDKAGTMATAQSAPFTVANPAPDTTPPQVALTAINPADGLPITAATPPVTGLVPVTVTATDAGGIASIELLVDGAAVPRTAPGRDSLDYTLDCSTIADGPHTLLARATDAAGNQASTAALEFLSSSPISGFKVTPAVATIQNPTVTISATLHQAAAWTLSFAGPAAIPAITGNGTAVAGTLNAAAYADGNYTVTLTVAGLAETPTLGFAIDVVENPPKADIANLANGAPNYDWSVTPVFVRDGLFELKGTADDPDPTDPVTWKVTLTKPDGAGSVDVTPKPVYSGWHEGRVVAGVLGTLDLTLIENGVYDLVLTVRGGTEYATDSVRIALDSPLKVGPFGFSQQDLVIPVSGLPISVIRTYNSLLASSSQSLSQSSSPDFGPGWTYAIADIRMEIDEERGIAFEEDGETTFDIHTGGGRDVTITMPDGNRTTFTYSMERASYGYRAKWTAAPGTYATLVPTCSDYLNVLPFLDPYWDAAGMDTPWENFDFPGFILTMKDGTKYSIERENTGGHFDENGSFYQTYGQGHLRRIEDRAGNQISISSDNIVHTNALGQETKRVVFQRTQGRIVAIHDPAGLDVNGNPTGPAQVTYEYDANGNLWKVNKLKDAATQTYETIEYVYGENGAPEHYITSIKDPRGITPLKTVYDDQGRIVATIDAYGNRIELSHDLNGRTETIFDRDGNPTIHAYDARGNVTETIDAQGNITRRTYDNLNNETSTTDALGNTTSYTFDGSGNRTSVTDALGNTTQFSYDGYGNQTSVTDPLGNVTRNEYDGSGNLLATVNALGQRSENRYDTTGNLTETRDALGHVTATFGYDNSGNMTSTADPNGVVRSFGYDANGNQTGTTFQWVNPDNAADIRNVITQTIYNAAGQVTETVDPENNHSFTEYNELGKPWKTTDKLNNVTETTYDARGNVIETVYSDGTITRTVYDVNGRTLATVDRHVPGTVANGSRTVYDSIGRVARSERLSNVVIDIVAAGVPACPSSVFLSAATVTSSTSSRYDAAGQVLESINADNEVTRYEYDASGRQTAVISFVSDGAPASSRALRTEYEYDVAGRQTLVRDTLGRETAFEYDSLGRRVKTIFDDGTTTLTQYDQLGRRIAETDQAGVTRNFEYDTQGRLIAVLLPAVPDPDNGGALARPHYQYFYDVYGRLETIRDPKGRETQFSYDQFGRQLTRELPMGQTESQAYNTLGQLDYKSDFKTQVTSFVYDTLGRVSEKRLFPSGTALPPAVPPAETVAFTYDDLGRQDTITDTRGITQFGYDQDGRVIQVASPEGTIAYQYDAVTGRKTRTSTANSDVRYAYDALGRLATVSVHKQQGVVLTQPEVTTYAYTEVGSRESMVLPNGVTTLYEYDNLNRLTNLSHFNSTNQLLAGYAYTLAPTGRRTGVYERIRQADAALAERNVAYSYDALNRLTQEDARFVVPPSGGPDSPQAFTTDYSYDLVGNRLAKATTRNQDGVAESITYIQNANDQLITETSSTKGVTSYSFDPNGSLISKDNDTTSEHVAYTYNLESRLTAADIARVEKDSQGTNHQVAISSTYQYNQSGIRTRAQSTTNIAGQAPYDTIRIFLNDAQNLTGYSQVMEEFNGTGLATSFIHGDDEISQTSATGTRWFSHDGHGNVRGLTDGSGLITNRYDFDAWGNMLGGNPGVTTPTETSTLWCGEQFDTDLQQVYLRARYYDQNVGVFASLDPFKGNNYDPQSLHKYAYAGLDPVNGVDPSGLAGEMSGTLVAVGIALTIAGLLLAAFGPAKWKMNAIGEGLAELGIGLALLGGAWGALKPAVRYSALAIAIVLGFAKMMFSSFTSSSGGVSDKAAEFGGRKQALMVVMSILSSFANEGKEVPNQAWVIFSGTIDYRLVSQQISDSGDLPPLHPAWASVNKGDVIVYFWLQPEHSKNIHIAILEVEDALNHTKLRDEWQDTLSPMPEKIDFGPSYPKIPYFDFRSSTTSPATP